MNTHPQDSTIRLFHILPYRFLTSSVIDNDFAVAILDAGRVFHVGWRGDDGDTCRRLYLHFFANRTATINQVIRLFETV